MINAKKIICYLLVTDISMLANMPIFCPVLLL